MDHRNKWTGSVVRTRVLTFGRMALMLMMMLVAAYPCPAHPNDRSPERSVSASDTLLRAFVTPPDPAKPRVYWWWLFNRVDSAGITRDLEQFRAKGISGVNLICTGGYAGKEPLPGVPYQSPAWWGLFAHAVKEAKRCEIELGFNLSAGGWTMEGPWVTKDNAMKKVVFADVKVTGPSAFADTLPHPPVVDAYYHDISVQAFRLHDTTKLIDPASRIDLTSRLHADGHLAWQVPEGHWVILRSGYTLTGHPWSRWWAYPQHYPQGDTFEGGDGYEIDYLSTRALDDHFQHLGIPILDAVKKAGGELAYFWSDSWECGKLTWTQDMAEQFRRCRGYDLAPFLPVLAGYTVADSAVSARFRDDFDRTIQDLIAENFYGHFRELCHAHGVKVGNEAAGPNDIPPIDALRNLGTCDIPAGEFWVNGHRRAQHGYNTDRSLRLNLKQTATAAHVYGRREAMAEAFTMMDGDATHWALGPSDLKPYANDAFCEGINRLMLHQSTCQPPSDGKPGYEFCAGQHFTPNITWWERSPAFFTYLARCQHMLQQGLLAADVCFSLGERPPLLAPPKYLIPSLGAGFDADYANPDVLLHRMSVKDGRIVLPDGMSYRLLVLQNCTSPVQEICDRVGAYQGLKVSATPSAAMSVDVARTILRLIMAGATVVGAPPTQSAGLTGHPTCDAELRAVADSIWGDLDGVARTERRLGKGRIIWGKTPREILLADGVLPDVTYTGQADDPEQCDFIHRTAGNAEIYFVINRTDHIITKDFTFRVAGKRPELWDPVTGEATEARAYRQAQGTTTVPLELDAFGSYFVVFRSPIAAGPSGDAQMHAPRLKDVRQVHGPWKVSFDTAWGGPAWVTFPSLVSWTDREESGIRYYSGTAVYRTTFQHKRRMRPEGKGGALILDLGDVKDVAAVRLNGRDLGVLWCAPWRVDITDAVRSGTNTLEVEVTNLWVNRVIGDLNLPADRRITRTHDGFRFDFLTGKTPLARSGLFGPVRMRTQVEGRP